MSPPKKSKIYPVHVEEAGKLKALFSERNRISQLAFGQKFEIGSQGMVWQYLNARAPINLDAALKFARALDCSVADFSPRLASALGVSDLQERKDSEKEPAPPNPPMPPSLPRHPANVEPGLTTLMADGPPANPVPSPLWESEEERELLLGYRAASASMKDVMLRIARDAQAQPLPLPDLAPPIPDTDLAPPIPDTDTAPPIPDTDTAPLIPDRPSGVEWTHFQDGGPDRDSAVNRRRWVK